MKVLILTFAFLLFNSLAFSEVIEVKQSCIDLVKGKKPDKHELRMLVSERCRSYIFCDNFGNIDVSIFHYCDEKGKSKDAPASPYTYFDFGNSNFKTERKYHDLTLEFNSISIQGVTILISAYGRDEDKRLISTVVRNSTRPRIDNRDEHASEWIYEKQDGFFLFEKHDKKDELVFYKISKCTKTSLKLPNWTECFKKEIVSYPVY